MGKVTNLDEHRPHLVINTYDGNSHVVPVSLVEDWARGEVEPDKNCLAVIIMEWLRELDNKSPG